MTSKRLVVAFVAALLGQFVLSSPAHAYAGYLCLIATAVQTGDTWAISSPGCTGSGTRDVPVHIWSGPSAGDCQCRFAIYYPLEAEFDATGCVRS